VELFYRGADFDGTVVHYDYFLRTYPRSVATIEDVSARLQTPAPGDPGWTRAGGASLELVVAADTLRGDPLAGANVFDRWHTFYVRAVDQEGALDATPAWVSFQAFTPAPQPWIQAPAERGATRDLPPTFVMNWSAIDSIGGTLGTQDPVASRWVLLPAVLDGGGQPLGFPAALHALEEADWSPWAEWAAPDSSGREAVFRDRGAGGWVFAVQSRDDGGAVTPRFDAATALRNNYAVLRVVETLPAGPRLVVHAQEDSLAAWTFDRSGELQVVAPDDTLRLFWDRMQTQHYGANGRDYRFGWDLSAPDQDDEWSSWSTARTAAPFALGGAARVFYVEARDHIGLVTRAVIHFVPPPGQGPRPR
jgi:hypothetical protein